MKFLISFVNSPLSLAGVDWNSVELFWSVPSDRVRACGVCYHGPDLVVASDDEVRRYGPGGQRKLSLPGAGESLAHSVHPVDDDTIGVVDTGHSCVRFFDRNGGHRGDLLPLTGWGTIPLDAIHLNDFSVTPLGIVASCFDFRPWRAVREAVEDDAKWAESRLGLLLNLTDLNGAGRIVGCGVDHPHSQIYRHPDLVHCSSASGTLHFWRANADGVFVEARRRQITDRHFLRGAVFLEGCWYPGGSVARHTRGRCDHMEIYCYSEADDRVESQPLSPSGEIYDILPWRDDIMQPAMRLLESR